MATDAACSNMASAVTSQGPRIMDVMLDFVDPLPLNFFANLGCPSCPNNCRGRGCGGASGQNGEGSGRGHCCRGVGLTLSLILVLGYF